MGWGPRGDQLWKALIQKFDIFQALLRVDQKKIKKTWKIPALISTVSELISFFSELALFRTDKFSA